MPPAFRPPGRRAPRDVLRRFCASVEPLPVLTLPRPSRGGKQFYYWWRGEDSNLRRLSRQIYSLIPLATREPLQILEAAYSA